MSHRGAQCLAGVQIATNAIDEALKAATMAEEAGASWIDLNCGCPIYGAAPPSESYGFVRAQALLKVLGKKAGIASGHCLNYGQPLYAHEQEQL